MCKSICQIVIPILTMALSGLSAATEVARDEALELMDESESPGFYFALGTRVPFDAIGGLFVAPVPQDLRLIPLPTPAQ